MALMRTVSADDALLKSLSNRTTFHSPELAEVVSTILSDVRARGDDALLSQAKQYDAPGLTSLVPSPDEPRDVPAEFASALETALQRITDFHRAQLAVLLNATVPDALGHRWQLEGEGVGQRIVPVRRAGVYVPGGRATYPSSVLMNAIPAVVAGVEEVILTTPSQPDGTLAPAVLAAADRVGVSQIVKVGGAAAIGALAFGTETVPRVDVIVGPGNRYVNEAKRQVWGQVALDGYAGPSEVCVVVDESANPTFAAADLLTQIEHAPDNAGYLVATSSDVLSAVMEEVELQLAEADRADTMRQALADHGLAILVRDIEGACEVVNAIAPEHCTLAVADPEAAFARIHNASCVLLGEWSAESAGDYAAGPSHTLPTSGAARFGSPVNVLHFLKVQSTIALTPELAHGLAPTIEAFGAIEGFPQHALGGQLRRRP